MTTAFLLTLISAPIWASEPTDTTLHDHALHEVVISATQVAKDAPFALSNIRRDDIQDFGHSGAELPHLLARTPGVIAWSENGLTTGTSSMRIRGTADSRINVTLDGVPLNSPDDQCVFWANTNGYASLLGSIQLQRGIGATTFGDGAFGANIALTSALPSNTPQGEVTASYGTYNTCHVGGQFSTGLLGRHWIIQGAYSQTSTDGYLHGTDGRSGSYLATLTWLPSSTLQLRYRLIGNFEHTGQAWNGVEAPFATYDEARQTGLARYNGLYESLITLSDGSFDTQRHTLRDGTLWPHATDNFAQRHHLLTLQWDLRPRWALQATLHYTPGAGYYDELKPQCALAKFGLQDYVAQDGSTVSHTDLVRQKGMDQHTGGLVLHLRHDTPRLQLDLGHAQQYFGSNHYGHLTYIAHEELEQQLLHQGAYTYYRNDSRKTDISTFARVIWHATPHCDLFGDLGYRYVHYSLTGQNDKYTCTDDGQLRQQTLDIHQHHHFLNPKLGLNTHWDRHRLYTSVAYSGREPERNNYTDNGQYPAPAPEHLTDIELGYHYTTARLQTGINLYAMLYTNQFVQTGQLSDIGEKLTTNISRSYRMGTELTAEWKATRWLTLHANACLSTNRILQFDEVIDDWDDTATGSRTLHYDDAPLAYSPTFTANAFALIHLRQFCATWHTQYVSRQYLDNTGCLARSLPAYTTSDIQLRYTLPCYAGARAVLLGLDILNIFDSHHTPNAWVYSAISESSGYTNDNRYTLFGFFPSAGFQLMAHLTLQL